MLANESQSAVVLLGGEPSADSCETSADSPSGSSDSSLHSALQSGLKLDFPFSSLWHEVISGRIET